jgi:hypothetical protein
MAVVNDNLMIEDARIMFRNFAGREKPFNSEGDRNFCIFLDPELADTLKAKGWNIKTLKPREEDDVPQSYVEVAVNYKKGRPPRVILISSRGRTDLGSDEVDILDYAEIKKADVLLNPYSWTIEASGNSGIKAYLKTAYITINEDDIDLMYTDVPDANPTKSSSTVSDLAEV